jgi:amino acid adenylation domain-containing protein
VTLEQLVITTAARAPSNAAVRAPDGTLTYAQLDAGANRAARALASLGVVRGDRVGVWMEKGCRAVQVMQGALRLGAAYVPLDPLNPAPRVEKIVRDCGMGAVLTSAERAEELRQRLPELRVLSADRSGGELCWPQLEALEPSPLAPPPMGEDELAYILYTSGSTGSPKGVCISHRNALAFICWAAEAADVRPEDRLGNHAPFFFDLSVFDLYAAFLRGACVSVVPEAMAFAPAQLVEFIEREQLTIWYSVPSALILMMEHGDLLGRQALPLRSVVFAGEPFPVKHLRRLRHHLPRARLHNWYGPTETNVCTAYEVQELSADRTEPVPIGAATCGDRVWLEPAGEGGGPDLGELVVEGPTVMLGYYGQPPHRGPYRTGDLCRRLADGNYEYLGRLDNMLKVRGRRMEPGEIEAALLTHPGVKEVAVLAAGSGLEARLVGFVVAGDGAAPTLLELKQACARSLPRYMIIDEVRLEASLPRTRNGKVDRKALAARLAAPTPTAR